MHTNHRRRFRPLGRRSWLAAFVSGLLLVGVCAATGIAGDPFAAGGGRPAPAATAPGHPYPGDERERPAGALPFDMPDPAALRAAGPGRLVFAHYFTPYPLSLDNARPEADYYARHYLTADGESGKHAPYGGLLRDRPLPVAPKGGDWEGANLRQEVRTARAAGIDGFTLDLLSLSGTHWERANLLMEAARSVDPDFRIMLMPDMTSLKTDDPTVLADAVAALGAQPAAHRLDDGRLVLSPFKAEAKDVAWWTRTLDVLERRHGIRTAFVPLFLDLASHAEVFAPISHGFSEWGSRSHTGQEGATADVRRAHALGKIWMQPVSVQDARPNQGVYDEAGNTATLRATWTRAIEDGADWVQLTTWNDYSEGSHFAPSAHNGHAYLDLSSYYLTRFKTGTWPRIVRDTLYLTSRTQFAAAAPAGGQQRLMSLRRGSAAARDTVEVLSLLTAPATVRTTVGTARSSYEAPAGLHSALLPLRTGTGSARVVRGGTGTAAAELPYPVRRQAPVQDLQYYAVTSGREVPSCC
ncbi:glycoside hydrolase family 71 protein [Streptomyces sp. NPDC090022]|uniref:glycoside hydrolase family 71 protein n=1 Tax=Streptomyces sp. NPDC090022 TaxID=3365920 RepID=UPI0037F597CE